MEKNQNLTDPYLASITNFVEPLQELDLIFLQIWTQDSLHTYF